MNHRIKINRHTGELQWLNPPPFKVPATRQVTTRFSEIVPSNPILRLVFRTLRYAFGDGEQGAVATWTRSWAVMWRLTILQGRHKGFTRKHGLRCVLLEQEQELWFSGLDIL